MVARFEARPAHRDSQLGEAGSDRALPPRKAAATGARLGWPLHEIDGAGHIPHADQPDDFVAALRASSAPE